MRQETVSATEAAIALSPDQSEYYARLAWLVSNHDPRKAKEALRRAWMNPWDARSWIELGLRAEAEGDRATSEECLLRPRKRQYVSAAMDAGELLFPARRPGQVLVLGEAVGGDGLWRCTTAVSFCAEVKKTESRSTGCRFGRRRYRLDTYLTCWARTGRI